MVDVGVAEPDRHLGPLLHVAIHPGVADGLSAHGIELWPALHGERARDVGARNGAVLGDARGGIHAVLRDGLREHRQRLRPDLNARRGHPGHRRPAAAGRQRQERHEAAGRAQRHACQRTGRHGVVRTALWRDGVLEGVLRLGDQRHALAGRQRDRRAVLPDLRQTPERASLGGVGRAVVDALEARFVGQPREPQAASVRVVERRLRCRRARLHRPVVAVLEVQHAFSVLVELARPFSRQQLEDGRPRRALVAPPVQQRRVSDAQGALVSRPLGRVEHQPDSLIGPDVGLHGHGDLLTHQHGQRAQAVDLRALAALLRRLADVVDGPGRHGVRRLPTVRDVRPVLCVGSVLPPLTVQHGHPRRPARDQELVDGAGWVLLAVRPVLVVQHDAMARHLRRHQRPRALAALLDGDARGNVDSRRHVVVRARVVAGAVQADLYGGVERVGRHPVSPAGVQPRLTARS